EFQGLREQAGWIQSLYQDLLGRLPAMFEWVFHARGLQQGLSHQELAERFLRSPERERELASYFYLTILGPTPDEGGLDGWSSQLQGGLRQEVVESGFLGSPEYYQRSGGTNVSFVRALYRQLLGRTPTAEEESYYVDRLAREAPASVAGSFVNSPEF